MSNPSIRVVGAYRVPLTDELFGAAMDLKYGGLDLTRRERAAAERELRAELGSVALVEVEVIGVDGHFDVSDFGQPDSDQAAYDDAYLSSDGERVLPGDAPPPGLDLRVAFLLHFFDWGKPLRTRSSTACNRAIGDRKPGTWVTVRSRCLRTGRPSRGWSGPAEVAQAEHEGRHTPQGEDEERRQHVEHAGAVDHHGAHAVAHGGQRQGANHGL